MATDEWPRGNGPVALSSLFEHAISRLVSDPANALRADGFLYSGNRHETVPRALFLDPRLTPLERNAWQVFRLRVSDDGVTAFPTYDELRLYLASTPCGAKASHETVARALTLLRLTRWLSLVRRRRDAKTGRILGNLYVLHDEPLTPFETMQLDPDYLGLVSQSLVHAAKAVQLVGICALREVIEDPLLRGRTLPARLQVLAERLPPLRQHAEANQEVCDFGPELNAQIPMTGERDLASESEDGQKFETESRLRIPKNDSTVRSKQIDNEVRTAPLGAGTELRPPQRFASLRREQQTAAMAALQRVDEGLRQAVLDEWAARCRNSAIRNPAGYLFGIIQKALRGEFKPWSAEDVSTADAQPSPASPVTRPATLPPASSRRPIDPEAARIHLEAIRAFLREA